jgi:hypothetical protein
VTVLKLTVKPDFGIFSRIQILEVLFGVPCVLTNL